ncbi:MULTISPECIES: hypothetical protein [unclassified Sinorhizobium]|uniref:hypothetical protein n=1 Tax=unclassified Sinorhizobium TaxID=2613772 RepID=UPI0024C40CCB|nr:MULTISPECIES: hypothetical protein [unclassified Sinorhizobium]MDK1378340.1 hypothetical protein [Sinorhizobium sp. 6-70]MDK1480250.1 hypothetical protein [Sinorhizobium sp. 6-117]
MVGKKTHEQQLRVLQGREKTSNESKDFDAEAKLRRSEALRKAYRKGDSLDTEHADARDEDERSMTRGKNQESRHHQGAKS